MATSFYGGAFFGGEFFSEPTDVTKTGGKGDNKDGGGQKRRTIFKPLGLPPKRKGALPSVERRIEETHDIAAQVAGEIAAEMRGEREALEARSLTEQEVTQEIARLLHKKIRTEEDEIMLLLLMAAAVA